MVVVFSVWLVVVAQFIVDIDQLLSACNPLIVDTLYFHILLYPCYETTFDKLGRKGKLQFALPQYRR